MGVKALWLNDAGAVRGAGLLARLDDARFLLAAAAPDRDWISDAAVRFDVRTDESISGQGGVALIGPFAGEVLKAAGLDPALEPLAFKTNEWRGLSVTLTRWGEHGGYELWCEAEDASIVWDRLFKAGAAFEMRAAGVLAMDLLDLERGIARPGRDYRAAMDGHAVAPQPAALSLERLIDETHLDFNGRAAWLQARAKVGKSLKGLVFDSEIPAPHVPVMSGGMVVGRTFGSLYSPALRRAIALAQLDDKAVATGTRLFVPLPGDKEEPGERRADVHLADLPFLPNPDPIGT
jgi:aminomethyltransferase